MEEMNQLRVEFQTVLTRLQASENQIAAFNQAHPVQATVQYEDIVTEIISGDQIQLETYKCIPEFRGDKSQYRSWRNQVTRQMDVIRNFRTHPKYAAALGIIRARVTGPASDVLTNNKTAYNIDAIIAQLDSSYADQRPLYVVEGEMTMIKQMGKTLQEYYEAINQALNMVISKIVMTYNVLEQQKSLVAEAQLKAIRTFIVGLKSQATRNVLYGQKPKTLAEAFTTAQTVYYDNQYLQLDQNRETPNGQSRSQQQNAPKRFYSGTNQQAQNSPARFNVNMNCNQPPQKTVQPTDQPESMDIDASNRFKQSANWRQPNQQTSGPQKREYDSSRQHTSQPNKMQRINQLQDGESNPQEGYEGDLCNDIPDDLISNTSLESDTASAFLAE